MHLKIWMQISTYTSRLKSLTFVGSFPFFLWVCIAHFCSFLFCVFSLFVVILCDYCVPNVASISGLSILIAPSVFPNAMHWFSVHLSSITVECRKLECFNLLQPTRHLSNEEGDNCPLAWWSIWNVKYMGRSEKNLINGSWQMPPHDWCVTW